MAALLGPRMCAGSIGTGVREGEAHAWCRARGLPTKPGSHGTQPVIITSLTIENHSAFARWNINNCGSVRVPPFARPPPRGSLLRLLRICCRQYPLKLQRQQPVRTSLERHTKRIPRGPQGQVRGRARTVRVPQSQHTVDPHSCHEAPTPRLAPPSYGTQALSTASPPPYHPPFVAC